LAWRITFDAMTQNQSLPAALIVAHGQPSEPAHAAAEIAALATRVSLHLPGWRVQSATLAEAEALPDAIAELGAQGVVYPLFMAGGWFTTVHLPERLAAAGGGDWRIAPPFGLDPGVQDLAVTIVREAGLSAGGQLLLAAHGSFKSAAPSEVANRMAARIGAELRLQRAEAAFIDQSPRLAEAEGFAPDAFCLPFFAAKGGHVIDDLPAALEQAGFVGRVAEPLGLDPRVPELIADALKRAMATA
jgi:sirohydrochlorin ferrochelatase